MNVKKHISKGLLLALFIFSNALPLSAARYNSAEEIAALNETRDSVDYLKHEHENLETDLKMLTERVANQESTLESLRQQILDANQANKDFVKSNLTNLTSKVASMEASQKGMSNDIKILQTHGNDSAGVLKQLNQQMKDLQELLSQQDDNIQHLQLALKALSQAVDTSTELILEKSKTDLNSPSGKVYKVKRGDTLGDIAKERGTTVKAIKELNSLTTDRISEGQLLQIP